jgi:ParB family transcriptional regulator, chromosome partitioning protein
MPYPLSTGLHAARHWNLFAEVVGCGSGQLEDSCGTVPAARLPLIMLAPVVVTYEQAMTSGEASKATWRHDKHTTCPYAQAGRYLAFLAELGYQLSAIEAGRR